MTRYDMSRWRMKTSVFALAALVVPMGCIYLAGRDPWISDDVIGIRKTASGPDLAAAWQGKGDPWKDAEKIPGTVIGGDSVLAGDKRAATVANAASANRVDLGPQSVERKLNALAARIDRLERIARSDGSVQSVPSSPARPPAPPVEIYKVDPSGQIAWVSAGTQKGMKKGQTLDIMRAGKAVGVARITRVWPDTSELAVLWATGALQRGDTVVRR